MISKKILIALRIWTCALFCPLFLSGCMEDEEQVRELRMLREKVSVAEKKAAEAALEADTARRELSAAAATASAAADSGMAERLQESQKHVAELEAQLAAARRQPVKPAESGGSFREHAKKVQENLMKQMGVLSDSLQARHSGPSLEEITVKKVQSGFRSEIVFGVLGSDGQMHNMAFPVEADLEGNWNLPSVEIIAKHLGAPPPQTQPTQPVLAQQTPAQPTAAPASPAAAANLPASPLPVANTVVIQWDQTPGRPAVAAAPANNPAAPAKPAAAPTPVPKAPPAPLMPVTKDVQIRFD